MRSRASLAGFKTDIFTIGLASIKLHLLFFALANAAFVAAAARVMRPGVAVAAAALVCFMPNQLANTQADSIMVSVYLLTAAALCLYLDRERDGAWPPLRYHLLVHLSVRALVPDAARGRRGLGGAVARSSTGAAWRYLALPAALYLAIGLSWGAYKYQYTGEFSMTTNTVGDNAWIGLWQVPSKFRWQTADASYFEWAARVGVPADLQARLRHGAARGGPLRGDLPRLLRRTSPSTGSCEFVDVNVFNGVLQLPARRLRDAARAGGLVAAGRRGAVRRCCRTRRGARCFLGWPLLFNLPLFLLFFSDGMRHVAPVHRGAPRRVRSAPARGRASTGRSGGGVGGLSAIAAAFVALLVSCPLGRSARCSPPTAGATGRRSSTRRRSRGICAEPACATRSVPYDCARADDEPVRARGGFALAFVLVARCSRPSCAALARRFGPAGPPERALVAPAVVPRAGGTAIALAVLVALALARPLWATDAAAVPVLLGGVALALIGLADDRAGLSAFTRLVAQLGVVGLVVLRVGGSSACRCRRCWSTTWARWPRPPRSSGSWRS